MGYQSNLDRRQFVLLKRHMISKTENLKTITSTYDQSKITTHSG